MDEAVADIVHETQEYLCTLFIKAHGEDGDYEYALDVRCEFLVPVFWGLGTVVFRVVGTGPRGASARTVSLSCLGWWVRWLCACRSLRYGFGGRC